MRKPTKNVANAQLRRAREYQGWSQEYVAQQVGTDAFTISRWERGVTMPSPHFRQKLTALFTLQAVELGLVPVEKEELFSAPEPSTLVVQAQTPARFTSSTPIFDSAIPSLPGGEHGLVGREQLLHSLKQRLLLGGRVALSALNGLPGVGKTALVTALAHDKEIQAHFADGILWMGLGYQPDVLGGLSRWGTLLGSIPADQAQRSSPGAWAMSIRTAIGQRRMLLVIDDAWQLEDALAFQVGGPNCAYLVTTRFPEIARRFAAHGVVVVRELEDTDGRLLLMRLAPEVVQTEPEEVQALVTAVGGLPLALTLLGNYLRAQAHSGQPRRLRAALERLRHPDERLHVTEPQALIGGHPGLASGTPLSLQAMISMSYQQMSEDARTMLRSVALFPPKPNTFSEEAALAVSAMPVEMLDVLSDTGLLESSGPEHYTLHQTIADYARTHLIQGQHAASVERMIAYFITYIETHTTDYIALTHESNNILAALELAFEYQLFPDFVRGVHFFVPWLETQGLYPVAEMQLQRALEATQLLNDVPGQVVTLLHRGKIACQRGEYAQAQTYWQTGLTLARQHAYRESEARLLHELGSLALDQGQPEQAHHFLTEALDLLRELEDNHGVAKTLKVLGNLCADQGQHEQARQFYQQALGAFHEGNDERGVAMVLVNLGILAREQGQPEQAFILYEQALNIFRTLGDRRSITVVLSNLSNLARQQQQFEQARRYLDESLLIYHTLESPRGYGFTLLNLGSLALEQGQFEQAHHFLDEAWTIFQAHHLLRDMGLTRHTQANLARQQGRIEDAHQLLGNAWTIFRTIKDTRQCALVRQTQGNVVRDQGRVEEARLYYNEALVLLEQVGDSATAMSIRQAIETLTQQTAQQA